MSERSKERDSRAANDFKTVWLRKAVLAHERVRSFACAMHSWVRTPLQPKYFIRFLRTLSTVHEINDKTVLPCLLITNEGIYYYTKVFHSYYYYHKIALLLS